MAHLFLDHPPTAAVDSKKNSWSCEVFELANAELSPMWKVSAQISGQMLTNDIIS